MSWVRGAGPFVRECPCADCLKGNPPRQKGAPDMTDDYVIDLHEQFVRRQAISHTDTRPTMSEPDPNPLATVAPVVLPWIAAHLPGWTIDDHHDGCSWTTRGLDCPCCRAKLMAPFGHGGCTICNAVWDVSCTSVAMRDLVRDNGRTQPRKSTTQRYVVPGNELVLHPGVTRRVPAMPDSDRSTGSSSWTNSRIHRVSATRAISHTGSQPHGSGALSLDTPSLQLTNVSHRSPVPALADGRNVNAADAALLVDANGLSATNEFWESLD